MSGNLVSMSRRQLLLGGAALMATPGLAGCTGSRTRDLSSLTLPPLDGLTRWGRPVGGLQNGELLQGVTVLVSWSSNCGYCRLNHEILKTAREQPRFAIAGIVSYDSAADARDYLVEHGNPYDFVAYDAGMQLQRLTGYSAVPTTYIVDAMAKIRNVFVGSVDRDRLQGELMPALRKLTDV